MPRLRLALLALTLLALVVTAWMVRYVPLTPVREVPMVLDRWKHEVCLPLPEPRCTPVRP